MNEGSFAEHKVEFSVQSGPRLCDRRGVRQHSHSSLHLRQITARYYSWWLIIDAYLLCSNQINKMLELMPKARKIF